MKTIRKAYSTDVSDAEWEFLLPYLSLMRQDAPQRVHDLREIFNGLRYVVKTGCPWRMLPHDLPEWEAVYQQSRRWMDSGVFEEIAHDYPEKSVHLKFFICKIVSGEPQPLDCAAVKWIEKPELAIHEFPAADAQLLERLRSLKFPA